MDENGFIFQGLQNEVMGMFSDEECLKAYLAYREQGLNADQAIALFALKRECTRVLVAEILINYGHVLPKKWMNMIPKGRKKKSVKSGSGMAMIGCQLSDEQ